VRLALITHKFVKGDGQGRVNYELAQAALAEGYYVWLVATEVAPELAAHPRARWVRIRVAWLPSSLLRNQLFAWQSALWQWRHRRELDLVHANGFVSWSRADINTSHFVHGAWLRSPFHTWRIRRDAYGLYQLLYSYCGTWLERWAYRRARLVVAVSVQVRGELIEAGVALPRLIVVPNGVDTEEFKPGDASRRALGLPAGKLLLFVGDIKTPRKNLDTLLRALVRVADASLTVVGDCNNSPYPRLAAELGLEHRVSFLGFRRDIARLMQSVDLFVFPSRYEACSLVLLEAAASGLPIVAARTTGGTELLSPACSVLVDDPGDEAELAATLNRLLENPAGLVRMGSEARRMALANSWQVMARRYLQLYDNLLRDHVGARTESGSAESNVDPTEGAKDVERAEVRREERAAIGSTALVATEAAPGHPPAQRGA
jgi:glycosyltransferase involved in cell wall biosynthesis